MSDVDMEHMKGEKGDIGAKGSENKAASHWDVTRVQCSAYCSSFAPMSLRDLVINNMSTIR